MPRIRTVKPEIWQDEALGRCPLGARLLYIGIITQADDEGRLRAAPALLRAAVFPYDVKVSIGTVQGWLDDLCTQRLVRVYRVEDEVFADIPSWSKHQTINRPRESSLPAYENRSKSEQNPSFAGDSVNGHGILSDEDVSPHSRNGREGNGTKKHVELSPDVQAVWDAYHSYHPRAVLSTTGKNNRRSIIERALRFHDAETCVAAVHGIHSSDYHTSHGYAGDLELTLRDADHIEKYAALYEPIRAEHRPRMTSEEYQRLAEQMRQEEEIPF